VRRAPHDIIRDRLLGYLGPHTTRNALKTFAGKSMGIAPEELTYAQSPTLLESMRPMLKTLIGQAACEEIIIQILRDLELNEERPYR
jgi:hypothetical protein